MLKKIHPVIRRALAVFLTVIILSILAVTISEAFKEDAYLDQQAEKSAMRIWKNKIDGSRMSNQIIDEYENSYTSLINRHIVGEENRLSWFEVIQSTTNARGMPSVKYNIASQKLVADVSGQHAEKGLKVYRSKMTLEIKMAHEGDLFAMLNNLEKEAKGLFIVDKCDIEKLKIRSKESSENVHSFCELSWYTFKSSDIKGRI